MLPQLTTLSKTFQAGETNYVWVNPAVDKTIYNTTKVAEKKTPVKKLEKDLSVSRRLALCEKNTSEADKQHVITKIKKYSKSIIKSIRGKFHEHSLSVLTAAELLPTNVYSQEFIEVVKSSYLLTIIN